MYHKGVIYFEKEHEFLVWRYLCCCGVVLIKWVHKFSKNFRAISKSRCQTGDMKQVSFFGPTNIMHHHTKFSYPGELVPEICAPLVCNIMYVLEYEMNLHMM